MHTIPHNLFNPNKLDEGGQTTINHDVGVMVVLSQMHKVHVLFKVLIEFEVQEFNKLASIVCPTICDNAHTMGVKRVMNGKLMKLINVMFAQLYHVLEARQCNQL